MTLAFVFSRELLLDLALAFFAGFSIYIFWGSGLLFLTILAFFLK